MSLSNASIALMINRMPSTVIAMTVKEMTIFKAFEYQYRVWLSVYNKGVLY
jgi:hypothetical protein